MDLPICDRGQFNYFFGGRVIDLETAALADACREKQKTLQELEHSLCSTLAEKKQALATGDADAVIRLNAALEILPHSIGSAASASVAAALAWLARVRALAEAEAEALKPDEYAFEQSIDPLNVKLFHDAARRGGAPTLTPEEAQETRQAMQDLWKEWEEGRIRLSYAREAVKITFAMACHLGLGATEYDRNQGLVRWGENELRQAVTLAGERSREAATATIRRGM